MSVNSSASPTGETEPDDHRQTDPEAPAEAPVEVVVESGRDLKWVRRSLLLVWAVALGFEIAINGIAFDRTRLILYLAFGMAAATVGRRRAITVIIDWLPFVLILMLYDWTRNIAVWLDMPTHWKLAVDADNWLFGVNPTVWLQSHIKFAEPPWWEVIVSVVYMSYFIVPYATAAVLWVRNRATWRRFAACFIATSFVGLIGYTLVPAAPPWAAAKCTAADVADYPHDPDCMYLPEGPVADNLLGQVEPVHEGAAPYVERISTRGWHVIRVEAASKLIKGGQGQSNLVAAIPSLHAGLTMMLALFMWPRTKALGRTMFMGYALVMAFALMYTAEHYFFDILLGWLLAALVVGTVALIDNKWIQPRNRRRAAREEAERVEAVEQAVLDGPAPMPHPERVPDLVSLPEAGASTDPVSPPDSAAPPSPTGPVSPAPTA
ncbi:phosphatase PAP2 family protein [Gordonia alkaliphila]|uniref:Inositolphosphotransferase Aur1/Ipt1 domain-containing protein n=1 Tax=Gordonia alkaliphila TaxID=1053547 RepID=A0ABP8ZB17_9ACTN|nr:phosphatase PAP2 family protein [Gordonia alkaliphila]MCK0438803.1 phosphatase PAP2 family protein [Gordonia alkaliphila]